MWVHFIINSAAEKEGEMGWIKRIVKWISIGTGKKSRRQVTHPWVNVGLDAASMGRKAGLHNQPPSDATPVCDEENYIRRECERHAANVCKPYFEELGELEQERRGLLSGLDSSDFKGPCAEARGMVCEIKSRATGAISAAVKRRDHWQRRFNELVDQGFDVSSANRGRYFLVFSVTIFLLVIESMANGHFIGQGSEGGFLAGIIEAFGIAILAVALSFAAGVMVRAVWGDGWPRRTFALLLFSAYLFGIANYHLVIGWYRASMVWGNPETAVKDALVSFSESGVSLPDIYSFGLCITGLFFSAMAFIAGLFSRDALQTAGHAHVARELEKANAKLQEEEECFLGAVSAAYMSQKEQIDEKMKNADTIGCSLRLNVMESRNSLREIEHTFENAQAFYYRAIEQFRQSCSAVRTDPSPAYFATAPPALDKTPFTVDEATIISAENVLEHLGETLAELRIITHEEKMQIRLDHEDFLKNAPSFLALMRSSSEKAADGRTDENTEKADLGEGETQIRAINA